MARPQLGGGGSVPMASCGPVAVTRLVPVSLPGIRVVLNILSIW